jgi:hypothetical protein
MREEVIIAIAIRERRKEEKLAKDPWYICKLIH